MLVALTLVGGLVVAERDAEACSRASCYPTLVAPGSGGSMPASAPGFVFEADFDTVAVELLDPNGAPIGGAVKKVASLGHSVFAPSKPLVAGTYTFRYGDCPDAGPGSGPTTKEARVTITPAVPLPTKAGTLRVTGAGRVDTHANTSSGSCTEEVDAAYVDLAIDLDAATAPYRDVLSWQTYVDGKWYWGSSLGTPQPATGGARSALRLFTACDTKGTSGRDNGLAAGAHRVELRPILAGGATTIAPAEIGVKVTCDGENGKVEPTTTTEPPATSPPPNGAPPGDATAKDPVYETAPANDGSGGCSAAAARPSSMGLGLLALVGLLAGARRKLRR